MKVSGTEKPANLWTFDNWNVSMVSFSKNKAKNMEETTTLSFMEVWKGVILKCDLFTGENVHQISIHLNIEYRKIYLITTLWSHPNTGNSGFCDFVHSCSPPQKKNYPEAPRMMHPQQGYITSLALMTFYLLTRNLSQDTSRLTEVHFILRMVGTCCLVPPPVRNENLWIPFWKWGHHMSTNPG